jgi:hypothetical protein
MYISTSLNSVEGLVQKMDILSFTFSIKPESIPYLKDKYGIRVIATEYTLSDIATKLITSAISNLNDPSLQVGSIFTKDRLITANINYLGDIINIQTLAYIAGGS